MACKLSCWNRPVAHTSAHMLCTRPVQLRIGLHCASEGRIWPSSPTNLTASCHHVPHVPDYVPIQLAAFSSTLSWKGLTCMQCIMLCRGQQHAELHCASGGSILAIITLAAPHQQPPVNVQASLHAFYSRLQNSALSRGHQTKAEKHLLTQSSVSTPLLSVAGGVACPMASAILLTAYKQPSHT